MAKHGEHPGVTIAIVLLTLAAVLWLGSGLLIAQLLINIRKCDRARAERSATPVPS